MDPKIAALSVFLLTYLSFVIFPAKRAHAAVAGAATLLLLNIMSPADAFLAVNWNVMGMFVGMLMVADVFMESRVPAYLAEQIVNRAPNTMWAILLICAMTGFISAFVENVATVLIVAPIAISLAQKIKLNPMNMLIAIAVSSNLQGAGTLIGDPPSMLLGGFTGMNFMDFFFYQGRPSIFWAVQLGALASFIPLYLVFRRHRDKAELVPTETVRSWVPTVILVVLIVFLALASFIEGTSEYSAGVLCMLFGVAAVIWGWSRHDTPVIEGIKKLDWETTFFLFGIFVLVGSLTLTGWITVISTYFSGLVGGDVLLGYILIVLFSVAASAFIDNVPYLAAMLPVAYSMADKMGVSPSLFLFGLLIGASLGGNITPIGASANIVACSILKKEGHPVSFSDFMKIGVPFTAAAVLAGSLFVWFVWR